MIYMIYIYTRDLLCHMRELQTGAGGFGLSSKHISQNLAEIWFKQSAYGIMPPHLARFWCGAYVALKGTDFVNAGAVVTGPSRIVGGWSRRPRRHRSFIGKFRYLLMYIAQADVMRCVAK